MSRSDDSQTLALIPARSGSKGIDRKNVRLLAGRPLIVYAIDAARASRRVTRIVVSTDSSEIAEIARSAGAETPFRRPEALARDTTPMVEVVRHALDQLARVEGYRPARVVLLQPTAPLREARHIDECVDLLDASGADAVISVVRVPDRYSAFWQFVVQEGALRVATGGPPAGLVPRRQDLPATYVRNGAVYAFRLDAFERSGSLYGERCLPYVMSPECSINIDTWEDWVAAEQRLGAADAGSAWR